MLWVVLLIVIMLLVLGPQWWVKYTLNKYAKESPELPGTGGELAKHLIERFQLEVKLEETEGGDHYDPMSKTVRLSPDNMSGRSMTAISVAAHEVGHAIQHHRNEPMLAWRTRVAVIAHHAQQAGGVIFLLMPIVGAFSRSPHVAGFMMAMVILSMVASVVMHLVTLPVEFDASFNKALPILKEGDYISLEQQTIAHKILKAAALTYVAAALSSILNVWRWLAVLRR